MALEELNSEPLFLNPDVLSDVISRVDGTTLARLTCVNRRFRAICEGESLWEQLCNERWPSTKQLTSLIVSVGGFRKLYSSSYPHEHGEQEESTAVATDFVSLVDVSCNGEPVLSRVVEGIPGAVASCGPLVNILAEDDDDGPLVKAPELRVSWILINKGTRQVVNLASWKPLSGVQHRPCGDISSFFLRFGSIVQTLTPIHCNITARCRPLRKNSSVIKLTDLGLTLEDVRSVHLRGNEAVAVLSRAMSSDTSVFHKFLAMQTSYRNALLRREKFREITPAVVFVGAIVIILISHILV